MKLLVVRFSSFGDVVQALSILPWVHRHFPKAQIHWVTLDPFFPLLEQSPHLKRVWTLKGGRGDRGFGALWKLALQLCQEDFTHFYDAHNHPRSRLLGMILSFHALFFKFRCLHRLCRPRGIFKRFLGLKLHIGVYKKEPFKPQLEMLKPLKKWGFLSPEPTEPLLPKDIIHSETQEKVKSLLREKGIPTPFIALAPSASYTLKRWPLFHWKEFIRGNPQWHFVILGGKEDGFLKDLLLRSGVWNLAGSLSLLESCALMLRARLLIANDTGLFHVADQMAQPCIGLFGPSALGWPSRKTSHVLTRSLFCRPCSKHGQGPCLHPQYQACLRGISPRELTQKVKEVLHP